MHTALLTLKEGFDGELTKEKVEVAVVGDDGQFTVLSQDRVQDYLAETD